MEFASGKLSRTGEGCALGYLWWHLLFLLYGRKELPREWRWLSLPTQYLVDAE